MDIKVVIKICLIHLILFYLISCVPKYLPVASPQVVISGDYAVITHSDEVFAVSEASWGIEPQYLPNFYTTMSIRIHNRSNHTISISETDFAIIDENGFQFDLVDQETVLDVMLLHPSLIPERFTMTAETQRENLTRRNEIRMNIIGKSFSFGDIHRGAIKDGILYFPKLDNKNKELIFIYKDYEIKFTKGK